jgi:hypothetical protein
MGPGEEEQGFPEQMGDISGNDTGYPDQSYGSAEYGDPYIQVCMGGHQPNPDYDPHICKQCMSECDIAHPLEPCEGSDLWCNAINANALSERRSCYENTCGWRCAVCI